MRQLRVARLVRRACKIATRPDIISGEGRRRDSRRVNLADVRDRALIDELYSQLAAQVSGFEPRKTQGTLLISSPGALVYYHADSPASVLWHIRG